MGDPVLAPEGLHARVHDGVGLYGGTQAGLRPAQRQGRRLERRPGERPRALAQRYQRDPGPRREDRKSTRLNSSHLVISYAVFCLKKKKEQKEINTFPFRVQSSDWTKNYWPNVAICKESLYLVLADI